MLATSGDQRSWFVHLYRRGRGVYEFDDDVVVGDPGHAVVIRSGDPYQASLTSMDSYVVCLDGSFVGDEIARLGFPESSAPALVPRRLDLRRRAGRMVRDLAVALRESMEAGSTSLLDHGPARRHLASAFVEAMLHRPGDPAPAHAAVTRPDDALDQLQQDIDRRLDDPLSLGDLCEVAGMGSRALQRACQARWGLSPMAYLAHCRLDRARALLRNARDGVTVAHVALSCGFVHLGRFSASYRDRFGELPSVTLAHAARRRA
jgi:AraC-like DNA-binding protein